MLKSISKAKIVVNAIPGGERPICICEAILLSAKEECDIELIHNDTRYCISIEKVRDFVNKEIIEKANE